MVYDTLIERTPIPYGWSGDRKYCVTAADKTKYLLRITPHEKSAGRPAMFEMRKQVAALGIPMCQPVECGDCDEGVYMLLTWVEGDDARDVIPFLPDNEQYGYGRKAGKILNKLHTIPAPKEQEDWQTRFLRKTDEKIRKYRACGVRFPGDERVIAYLENNRDVCRDRPQSFQHGDYHIGNMMLSNGELIIIDFDRLDFGDPWEEFNRIVWCAQAAPRFATGMIDGYFDDRPPMEFWRCLAFYIGSNTLSSIYWALGFGQSELDTMIRQSQDVLSWYDNMQTVVPGWYQG